MTKKIFGIIAAMLAVVTGIFPFVLYLNNIEFGIISSKSSVLLNSYVWQLAFHTHIVFAAIALLTGWVQFVRKLRIKHPLVHRNLGKTYIICALLSAVASIYIGFFATGGLVPSLGFISLSCVWIYSTVRGYDAAIHFNLAKHRQMMLYSYAACFAGVTLRLELPLLEIILKDYEMAYAVVAWLCWVPNMAVAYLIAQKRKKGGLVVISNHQKLSIN